MNQAVSTCSLNDLDFTDSEEDFVITDVTRSTGSKRKTEEYEKWRRQLRIALIREHYEAEQKKTAVRKPILLQLLNLEEND